MAVKLDIDTLCNKYYHLFSYIESLGKHIYSDEIKNNVLDAVKTFKTDIENFKSGNSTFTPLT